MQKSKTEQNFGNLQYVELNNHFYISNKLEKNSEGKLENALK